MLKLGEKGTILQRDNQTYAVAPHIPCGVLTPNCYGNWRMWLRNMVQKP
jgi:hypothetical protein